LSKSGIVFFHPSATIQLSFIRGDGSSENLGVWGKSVMKFLFYGTGFVSF